MFPLPCIQKEFSFTRSSTGSILAARRFQKLHSAQSFYFPIKPVALLRPGRSRTAARWSTVLYRPHQRHYHHHHHHHHHHYHHVKMSDIAGRWEEGEESKAVLYLMFTNNITRQLDVFFHIFSCLFVFVICAVEAFLMDTLEFNSNIALT
uniref:Uncharacterized protein n=1 Tax=Glossina pallidipes TaxID=7398 RepID=A0A1A9ZR72_GLOPL